MQIPTNAALGLFATELGGMSFLDAFKVISVVAIISGAVIFLAFLILLSLPRSRLRAVMLEVVSWISMGLSAFYVCSPVDLIPDPIPVIGVCDDAVVGAGGFFSLLTAIRSRRERKQFALSDAR